MTPSTIAVRDALRAALLADPAIVALVGERIYDRVPAAKPQGGALYPFLAFGPMRRDRLELGHCAPGQTIRIRLYAASTEYERDQAWDVVEAADAVLEGATPAIAGPFMVDGPLQVTMAGDAIDPLLPRAVFLDVVATVSPTA